VPKYLNSTAWGIRKKVASIRRKEEKKFAKKPKQKKVGKSRLYVTRVTYDFELQRQRCKKFTAQLTAWRVFIKKDNFFLT
jgi:hypothetical protein